MTIIIIFNKLEYKCASSIEKQSEKVQKEVTQKNGKNWFELHAPLYMKPKHFQITPLSAPKINIKGKSYRKLNIEPNEHNTKRSVTQMLLRVKNFLFN